MTLFAPMSENHRHRHVGLTQQHHHFANTYLNHGSFLVFTCRYCTAVDYEQTPPTVVKRARSVSLSLDRPGDVSDRSQENYFELLWDSTTMGSNPEGIKWTGPQRGVTSCLVHDAARSVHIPVFHAARW